MRSRPALLLFASVATAAVALTACGRTGFEFDEDPGNIPRPFGFPDSGETPVPTPTPRFGTGVDDDLVIDGAVNVVNVCHVLVATSGIEGVFVGTAAAGAFKPMDRVLLLQVQGRRSTSGDQTPINVLDSAGQWQVSEVVLVAGTSVLLAPGPAFGFRSNPSSRAQICRMPQYRNVFLNTDGILSASDWNGSTGGVAAFFVSSTLTLADNAVVEATSGGFRGGPTAVSGNNTGITALDPLQQDGGRKGEGLDPQPSGRFGRGNVATGAGGGNGSDGGGGGGGNGGAGGIGGREFATGNGSGGNVNTRGLGGVAVVASLDSRLLFGGGAGAGHRNGGIDSTGGSGGGVVLIFARALAGDGAIRADGRVGVGGSNDGGGGGGAGGTIRTEVESSTFTGSIEARGGGGANVAAGHGTGGGGGGGRIRLLGVSTAGLSSLDVSEGQSGTATGQGARGALNGLPGVVVTTP